MPCHQARVEKSKTECLEMGVRGVGGCGKLIFVRFHDAVMPHLVQSRLGAVFYSPGSNRSNRPRRASVMRYR